MEISWGISRFFLAYLLATFLHSSWVESASLYEIDDPLWELDPNNFDRIILGKKTAWIIEFYSSWCGHCIRFAPHWVEFARDIENWKNVIEVAVLNCADSENTQLCRKYEVTGYPTIKLFPTNLNSEDKGRKYEGNRDLPSLRHSVIDLLETNQNRTIPPQWPSLKEVKSTSVAALWKELPSSVNSVFIAIENRGSYVGREVILDFSIKKNTVTRRMLNTNTDLLRELVPNYHNSTLVLVNVYRNGKKEVLYTSPDSTPTTEIRDKVFEMVIGHERVKKPTIVTTPDPTSDEGSSYNNIFMVDLENAVHYALYQEVSAHEIISGEKLSALKAFILALKKYFPGNSNATNLLIKLNNWIHSHRGNVTGARFSQKLDQLKTATEFLPEMRPYVGCKGSNPKYRGYPCSLWTLFHFLTVQAYEDYQESALLFKEPPQKILHDIRGYVKNFFSCQHCSEHFQKMSANLDIEAAFPKDTVLWLWQAHNRVNKRLSGDATEDPKHKKVQFPTEEACGKCRLGPEGTIDDIPWEKSAVMLYMRYFYNKDRIVVVNSTVENTESEMQPEHTDSEMQPEHIEDNSLNHGRQEISQVLYQLLGLLPLMAYGNTL